MDISVAEPESPGAATFRAEPEPIFLLVGAGSRSLIFLGGSGSGCIFYASKKEKPCSCVNHDIKSTLEGYIWSKIDLY